MGIQAPAADVLPMHRQCDVLLGSLDRLGILSMGACHLQVGRGCWGGVGHVGGGKRELGLRACVGHGSGQQAAGVSHAASASV